MEFVFGSFRLVRSPSERRARDERGDMEMATWLGLMETYLTKCGLRRSLLRSLSPVSFNGSFSLSRPSSALLRPGECAVRKAYDGLLVDAGGTLLQLQRPVEETYASIGRKYGLTVTAPEIKRGFKKAFSAPWPEKLRYQGDGRPFWKPVVSQATGCKDHDYFEEVYQYYANGDAWCLPNGAHETLSLLKDFGVKLAVVSNFDNRLRKLLEDLNIANLFDAIIISSEVGYEKPDPEIFKVALDYIGVVAGKAVHVGDDQKADKDGAAALGIDCWLWGVDVKTFSDIRSRVLIPE